MSYGELLSRKLCTSGRFEEAIAAADAEIAAQPDEPEAHFNRGQALAALERFAEAAVAYERALAMDDSGSTVDREAVDDELFFALRSEAMRTSNPAVLRRYLTIAPEGRHVSDVAKWLDKLNGVEPVWVRDRA